MIILVVFANTWQVSDRIQFCNILPAAKTMNNQGVHHENMVRK